MKRILFPTELSDHAGEVLRFALELTQKFNARLTIMSSVGDLKKDGKPSKQLEKDSDERMDGIMGLVNETMSENKLKGLRIDYLIKTGKPSEAILNVALEEEADIIVLGMTGKTNGLKNIFGSTALKILAKADCPVFLVPKSVKFKKIKNIIYTTNFEFRDLKAINYLRNWSEILIAKIHCLHISDKGRKEIKTMKNKVVLRDTYKNEKKISFEVIQGNLAEEIEKFAREKKVDLITMITRKRNFISSILQQSEVDGIIKGIKSPVLVLKDDAYEINNDAQDWLTLINSFT